jgi:hypothetical protein
MIRPIETPANTTQIKFKPACQKIKLPAITAANDILVNDQTAGVIYQAFSFYDSDKPGSVEALVTDVVATASEGDTIAPIKKGAAS